VAHNCGPLKRFDLTRVCVGKCRRASFVAIPKRAEHTLQRMQKMASHCTRPNSPDKCAEKPWYTHHSTHMHSVLQNITNYTALMPSKEQNHNVILIVLMHTLEHS
jgi:hypothetical protein